jgi:hypothetical protein
MASSGAAGTRQFQSTSTVHRYPLASQEKDGILVDIQDFIHNTQTPALKLFLTREIETRCSAMNHPSIVERIDREKEKLTEYSDLKQKLVDLTTQSTTVVNGESLRRQFLASLYNPSDIPNLEIRYRSNHTLQDLGSTTIERPKNLFQTVCRSQTFGDSVSPRHLRAHAAANRRYDVHAQTRITLSLSPRDRSLDSGHRGQRSTATVANARTTGSIQDSFQADSGCRSLARQWERSFARLTPPRRVSCLPQACLHQRMQKRGYSSFL